MMTKKIILLYLDKGYEFHHLIRQSILSMIRSILISIVLLNFLNCKAQDEINDVVLKFKYFKYPETEYKIDYNSFELICISLHGGYTILNKTYKFTEAQIKNLKIELHKDIPDSILLKGEDSYDGGGFTINYIKKSNDTSKIIVHNPILDNPKYSKELHKIKAFSEFAYSIIRDSTGIDVLDICYSHNYSGLPVRKISDNPLEYKVWGSMSGNLSGNPKFITFLDNLPKNKCVIIDGNNKLSYAIEEDVLILYTIKNCNIKFVNIDLDIESIRENLVQLRKQIRKSKKKKEEFKVTDTNKQMYELYINYPEAVDKWLALPIKSLNVSIVETRKSCK